MNFNNQMFGPANVIVNPPIVTRSFSTINRNFIVEQPYIHEHVTNIVNHHIRRNICCYKPLCCEHNTFCEENVGCCNQPLPRPGCPGMMPGVEEPAETQPVFPAGQPFMGML